MSIEAPSTCTTHTEGGRSLDSLGVEEFIMSIPKPLMSLALLLILLTHMFTASKFTFTPKKILISCISSVFLPMSLPLLSPVSPAYAKTELPSLEKCFNAIKTELDPVKGESIKRIKNDINNDDW
jgi:hypothetical protein